MNVKSTIQNKEGYGPQSVAGSDALVEREQQIPGAVQYRISRYVRDARRIGEDYALIRYECNRSAPKVNYLELKFCVAGNIYCHSKDCSKCSIGQVAACQDSIPSFDVLKIKYEASQLSRFTKHRTASASVTDELLLFKKKASIEKQVPLCCKTRSIIEGLLSHPYEGSMENIFVNAQLQMLLLFGIDNLANNGGCAEPSESCSFLSNLDDKAKIVKAREVLIKHIGEPITIKDLSRKVAINECYLKKGFKEMYGTTIFEYYQNQRMEHAKYLLYEKGLSVTEVSMILGYSSISHFSTAFKKQTGLKPCELLLR